eukprot:TRINITY_DN10215_c0_g1_i15.p1 TRINITY_DN10215_c0_g1~~TRINITY_DN10215_c0_g1_i15.p1  ORF type:complete len:390 (-),score=112.95 TRINITY_DN10215_c0_g1_i15:473-1642(-)
MRYELPKVNRGDTEYPFRPVERVVHKFAVKEEEERRLVGDGEYFREESKSALENVFGALRAGEVFTLEDKLNALDWMSTMESRSNFAFMLKAFSADFPVLSKEDYQTVAELCNYVMAEWIAKSDNDVIILNNLLLASRGILRETENTKEFLYSQLIKHAIWQEKDIWRRLIDKSIEVKIGHIKMSQDKKSQGRTFTGLFSKMRSAVATNISKLLVAEEPTESLECKAAVSVLSHFCCYLSHPLMEAGRVVRLYQEYAEKYGISHGKFADLKLELMKCQKAPESELNRTKSIVQRNEVKFKKYGKFLILSLTIKYLEDKTLLRNLLLLSKESYGTLKIKVFRQVLIKLNIQMPIKEHMQVWAQILDIVISHLICRVTQRQSTSGSWRRRC